LFAIALNPVFVTKIRLLVPIGLSTFLISSGRREFWAILSWVQNDIYHSRESFWKSHSAGPGTLSSPSTAWFRDVLILVRTSHVSSCGCGPRSKSEIDHSVNSELVLLQMSLLTRPTSRLPTYAEAVSAPAYIHEPFSVFLRPGRLILLIYVPISDARSPRASWKFTKTGSTCSWHRCWRQTCSIDRYQCKKGRYTTGKFP